MTSLFSASSDDSDPKERDSVLEKCKIYFRMGPTSEAAFPVAINTSMGVGVRFKDGFHGFDLSGETTQEMSSVDLKAGYLLFGSENNELSMPFIGFGMKYGLLVEDLLSLAPNKLQLILTPGFQFAVPSGNTHFIQCDLSYNILEKSNDDSIWGVSYGWLF